jgi:hypothetical protein
MKIKEIKLKKDFYCVYEVTFVPYWFEKLFGVKEKTKEYQHTGAHFTFGGGGVYRTKDGNTLDNGNWIAEAIDRHIRKW